MGEDKVGTGEDAERVEMMLADPGRVHAELIGVDRFVSDVGDELVGVARVVFVVIVAEREVSEFHGRSPSVLAVPQVAVVAAAPRSRIYMNSQLLQMQ